MPQTITVDNFSDLNVKETLELSADIAAAVTTLPLKYSTGLVTNDYLYIGQLAGENSEVVIADTITSATSITIDAPGTVKAHSKFDPISQLFGNQIRIYRAANVDGNVPADGSFSLLATVTIDFDQTNSTYTDASGDSTYWYKFTYYNQATTAETSLGDSGAVRGGNYGNYASIESIRAEAGLQNNRYVSDGKIDQKRQSAQAYINSELTGVYTLPFTEPINPLIQEITQLLAAGYLLTDNYGPLGTLNTNEGQQKIDRVTNKDKTGLLDKLADGRLQLTDESGTSTAIPGTAGGFGGWPDGTTDTAASTSGGAERAFRMSDRF